MYIRSMHRHCREFGQGWLDIEEIEERDPHLIRAHMRRKIAAWHGKGWSPILVPQPCTWENEDTKGMGMTGYACLVLEGMNSSPGARETCAVLITRGKLRRSENSMSGLMKKRQCET